MNTDRRSFLRNSAILAAGSTLFPAWTTALAATATNTRTLSPALPLTSDDQAVLAWVARYATSYRLQGGCILGKLSGARGTFTEIVAYMTDPSKFSSLLSTKSPLSSALVNGDSYSFQYGNTIFTLRNSTSGLPTVTNADWMHAPIQYDPVTHILTDPLGDLGTGTQINLTLKLVTKVRTLPQNFQALASGLVDSKLYKLKQDTTFNTFRNSVLNSRPRTASDAAAVNRLLLQNLPALTLVYPANTFGTFLQSPLLTACLATQFTPTTGQLAARFSTLRARISPSYSDDTLWLALLLPNQKSPQNGDLANSLCLPANSGLNAFLAFDALTDMRQLLSDPTFTAA